MGRKHHRLKYGVALCAILATAQGSALMAQESEQADQATATQDEAFDEIVVKGFRRSLKSAIDGKRDSKQIIDAIISEEIGKFPDQNVAEAIQRVTGVSMSRQDGEGQFVTIRGLSPELTRVEVNGRSTFLSSGESDPSRATSLSVFGSDLFSRIEVVKSPTAKDDEGGVGGIVRLVTPKPMEIGELKFGGEAKISKNEVKDDYLPSFNAFFSNVWADGKFGVTLFGGWSDGDRRLDQMNETNGWSELDAGDLGDGADPSLAGGFYPERLRQQLRVGENPRMNLNATVQIVPTDTFEVVADFLYTKEDRNETLWRLDNQYSRLREVSGGTIDEDGTLTSLDVDRVRYSFQNAGRERDITTKGATITPKWANDVWSVEAEVSYSQGKEDANDATTRARAEIAGGYDATDPLAPVNIIDFTQFEDDDYTLDRVRLTRRVIETTEKTASFDIDRTFNDSFISQVYVGGKYRVTEIDRRQGELDADGDFNLLDHQGTFPVDEFYQGEGSDTLLRSWPGIANPIDFVTGTGIGFDDVEFDPFNGYNLEEETYAAYGMADFEGSAGSVFLRGNVGARYVKTKFTGTGVSDFGGLDDDGNVIELDDPVATVYTSEYNEWLPSANLILSGEEDAPLQFRFAAGRVMTRPTPVALNPVLTIDSAEDFEFALGNPELDPFIAWQYDAGLEYYFGETNEGMFSLAFFYKDVENFFEITSLTGDDLDVGLPSNAVVETYINGGSASIKGIEVGLQSPFTFLPDALQGLGGLVNYTYVDSERTLDDGTTASMPGNSKHTFNAVLYYEKAGFSSRLAYNFRDTYIVSQNDNGNVTYVDGAGQLDFSARYRFENGVRIAFDAANLLGRTEYTYADVYGRLNARQQEGTIYSLSMAYTF